MKAKKLISRILVFAMVLCMMVAVATPVAAAEANQAVTDAKSAVVQIQIWFVDNDKPFNVHLTNGTGFLINEDTVITCEHVVQYKNDSASAGAWADYVYSVTGVSYTPAQVMERIELRISVLRDVHVRAKLRTASTEMDYAILTLEEKLHNRTTLPLRSSETLKQTEAVYALGFPADVLDIADQNYYDADDVTITSGTVDKVGADTIDFNDGRPYNNVDCVAHSALISGGSSGGPLVDASGNVVGINAAIANGRNLSVASDQLIATLEALGIDYYPADPVPVPTEAPAPVATEAPAPVATEAPVTVATEATIVNETEKPVTPDNPAGNMTIILIVAAVAVVAVVVVVVVVLSGKNKKKAAPAPAAYAHTGAPAPHNNAGFQTAHPTPAYTAPMDAGETSVLSQSAGETTVLSRHVNGGTLIRKRTGESVGINTENFVIGRERKTSNYCIADNTSISRSHVTLNVRGGITYLTDMNAANGTFVNGVKVMPRQEIALKNGDKITLADEDFEFRA